MSDNLLIIIVSQNFVMNFKKLILQEDYQLQLSEHFLSLNFLQVIFNLDLNLLYL